LIHGKLEQLLEPQPIKQSWSIGGLLCEKAAAASRTVRQGTTAGCTDTLDLCSPARPWLMLTDADSDTLPHGRMVFQADVATKSRFQRKELQSDTPQDGRTFATYREK